MPHTTDHTALLQIVRRKHLQGEYPSRDEMRALVDLSRLGSKTIGETALTLLLQPPVSDEPAYYARCLIPFLAANVTSARKTPPALADVIYEIADFLDGLPAAEARYEKLAEGNEAIVFSETIPGGQALRKLLMDLLRSPPKSSLESLFSRRLPLKPFLCHMSPGVVLYGFKTRGARARGVKTRRAFPHAPVRPLARRWRILRKLLLSTPSLPAWSELTTADLAPLWKKTRPGESGASCPFRKGRWLAVSRRLATAPACVSAPAATDGKERLVRLCGSPQAFPVGTALSCPPEPRPHFRRGVMAPFSDVILQAAEKWTCVGAACSRDGDMQVALAHSIAATSRSHKGVPLSRSRYSRRGHTSRLAYWGGSGNRTLLNLEMLLRFQAKELDAVRSLAVDVSQTTRRVVLSWHNATLAAAGGWAFGSLRESFPSASLWQAFRESVTKRVQTIRKALAPPPVEQLDHLFALWVKRLVTPKIVHALWESRIRAGFDPAGQKDREREVSIAERHLGREARLEISQARKLGWHGAVSPHQRLRLGDVLAWCESRRAIWQDGLILLRALMEEGQKLLRSGDLPHLVLPWIDKFFISSRREEDHQYLPGLIQWLESCELETSPLAPLVLFHEDTAHAKAPSFQLALKLLVAQGHPYRGIGVFDWDSSSREDAREIICREHSRIRLFALRPIRDTYNPQPPEAVLSATGARFFEPYDSSWKDNLVFLYTGTQVFPLVSVQCEMERFPAWVVLESGLKLPFGAFFRSRLRRQILGTCWNQSDPLCRMYSSWANLD